MEREKEMTLRRMIELLETEHECMTTCAQGLCNRDCASCPLVQDDRELDEMYTKTVAVLEGLINDGSE